ncbi:MAG TPA: hypothetical protein VIU11_12520 [Nakamurella sp.]
MTTNGWQGRQNRSRQCQDYSPLIGGKRQLVGAAPVASSLPIDRDTDVIALIDDTYKRFSIR